MAVEHLDKSLTKLKKEVKLKRWEVAEGLLITKRSLNCLYFPSKSPMPCLTACLGLCEIL